MTSIVRAKTLVVQILSLTVFFGPGSLRSDELNQPSGKEIVANPTGRELSREEAIAMIYDIARNLDEIEEEVEEWGHASATSLILMDPGLTLNVAPEGDQIEHVAEERGFTNVGFNDSYSTVKGSLGVQGGASISESTGASLGLRASTEGGTNLFNIEEFEGNLSATFSDDEAADAVRGEEAREEASPSGAGVTPVISESDRIKLAISAVMSGKIADFFSDPIGLSANKKVFLAMSQVSVIPGWRTTQNYACEIQLIPEYLRGEGVDKENSLSVDRSQPMTSAAFPMAEAQILDLQFNQQQQIQFLMDIAGQLMLQGKTVKANAIVKFVRKFEREVVTRNAIPTVVPSSDGTQLSYRFNPALQAVDKPFSRRGKPANVLNATSIPVMTVVVCDVDDLERWDKLQVTSNVRWVPIERQHVLGRIGTAVIKNKTLDKRHTNVSRIEIAKRIDHCLSQLRCLRKYEDYNGFPATQFQEVANRFRTLETLGIGLSVYSSIPLPAPKIDSITPNQVLAGKGDVEIEVHGSGFLPAYAQDSVTRDQIDGFLDGVKLVRSDSGISKTASKHYLKFVVGGQQMEDLFRANTDKKLTFSLVTAGGTDKVQLGIDKAAPKPVPEMQITGVGPATWSEATVDSHKAFTVRGNLFPESSNYDVFIGGVELQNVKRTHPVRLTGIIDVRSLPVGIHDVDVLVAGQNAYASGVVTVRPRATQASVVSLSPGKGNKDSDTYVKITGVGFVTEAKETKLVYVFIDGEECEFRVKSNTEILAKVSKGPREFEMYRVPGRGVKLHFRLRSEYEFVKNEDLVMSFPYSASNKDPKDDEEEFRKEQAKLAEEWMKLKP